MHQILMSSGWFSGVDEAVWWDGFAGAIAGGIIGGLVAIIVAKLSVRGQLKSIERQVKVDHDRNVGERYERVVLKLLTDLPALGDRTRTYATDRREEVEKTGKYVNLQFDTQREMLPCITLLGDDPLNEFVREVPAVFALYAERYGNILRDVPDAGQRARVYKDASRLVTEYVDRFVKALESVFVSEDKRPPFPSTLHPPSREDFHPPAPPPASYFDLK